MKSDEILNELVNAYLPIFMDNFGAGKSISSTFLNIIMAYFNNRSVMLSNTPMFQLSSYDIEFIPLISTSQLSENHKDTQINLDELQKIANSRDSASSRNSFVTEFSTDIRKFNQGISATCQFGNTIDVRLYDNADFIIIPEWKKNQPKREKRTNFNSIWNILNKEQGYTETLNLDLSNVKNLYNTNFKPFRIVVNHDEYLEKIKSIKSQKYYDDYLIKCDKEINRVQKIFNIEMKGNE